MESNTAKYSEADSEKLSLLLDFGFGQEESELALRIS